MQRRSSADWGAHVHQEVLLRWIDEAENGTLACAIASRNRLNVAVTRAKRGVKVICSFDPDTLAVETAKNRGPRLFKQYLQYARAVSQKDHYASTGCSRT